MTNQELARRLRYKLFADEGSDLDTAMQTAYRHINNISPSERIAASVALHIVLNTVANIIMDNEMGETK